MKDKNDDSDKEVAMTTTFRLYCSDNNGVVHVYDREPNNTQGLWNFRLLPNGTTEEEYWEVVREDWPFQNPSQTAFNYVSA